jgi:hypothetical protein
VQQLGCAGIVGRFLRLFAMLIDEAAIRHPESVQAADWV